MMMNVGREENNKKTNKQKAKRQQKDNDWGAIRTRASFESRMHPLDNG